MFKQKLQKDLQKQLKKEIILENSPSPDLGDYALHAYKLKISPQELQQQIKLPNYIERTEIKGPYLNFFIKTNIMVKTIIETILKEKKYYGSSKEGKNKHILIEHTSINPNASPHLGRARNAIIGDTIVRILKFQGYKTEVHYYVNDIGKQIAMLVLAAEGKKPSFKDLLHLYVEFNKHITEEKEKKVFSLLYTLEQGDKETLKKFKTIVNICIKGQTTIFKDLDIHYNKFDYESKYINNKILSSILKDLEKTKRLLKDQEGRICINLEGFNLSMKAPILPLTRSDGTSMYQLRDLAYAKEKQVWAKGRNIIVLGEDQKLYFQQLKVILSLLKISPPELIHYSYVLLKEGKMSTRQGNVVLLEDFMREAKQKALREVQKRKIIKKNQNLLAKKIAYAAVKFTVLKVSPEKNIIFDLEEALSFEGDTAPYIQYTYARTHSILKKLPNIQKADLSRLQTYQERNLIKKMEELPERVQEASDALKSTPITSFLLELTKLFSDFYQACPVQKATPDLQKARILLLKSYLIVIENASSLLGIELPQQM